MELNYYQILGVSYRATADEIKAAYKKLALKYHPDRNQGSRFHEEHFKKVLEAYQTLSDQRRKDLYDIKLFYGAAKAAYSSPKPSTPPPTNQQNTQGPEFTNPYRRSAGGTGGRYNYGSSGKEYATRTRNYKGEFNIFAVFERPLNLHTWALVLAIGASFIMLWLWAGSIRARHNAEYYFQGGEYALAIEADPQYAPAYFERAKQYRKEEKWERSLQDATAAIQYSETQRAEYFLFRADLYTRLENYPRAVEDLEIANSLRPGDAGLLSSLGYYQIRYMKDAVHAQPNLQAAYRINPNNVETLTGLGLVAMKNNQPKDAIPYFQQATAADTLQSDTWYFLGVSEVEAGDRATGCLHLYRAARLGHNRAQELTTQLCGQ